jgi:hypothetical protein
MKTAGLVRRKTVGDDSDPIEMDMDVLSLTNFL